MDVPGFSAPTSDMVSNMESGEKKSKKRKKKKKAAESKGISQYIDGHTFLNLFFLAFFNFYLLYIHIGLSTTLSYVLKLY
jgi:hypothetical protein